MEVDPDALELLPGEEGQAGSCTRTCMVTCPYTTPDTA
ncbi:ALQxL family class IV lanthipeptide [Kitasatospora sp. NPDC054939]